MNADERRRYDMLARVRDFGAENASDFPPGSVGADNFATVGAVVGELDASGAAQASGMSSGRQGTAMKSNAREDVREELRAINRTARALALDDPGLSEKFLMPRGDNDQKLIAAARAFITDAEPLKNEFVKYGLNADFLSQLQADIASFEQAVGDKNAATVEQVGATAAIDAQIERGMIAVRRLKAIVTNKYVNNSAKLAAWLSASHVENAPRLSSSTATAKTQNKSDKNDNN